MKRRVDTPLISLHGLAGWCTKLSPSKEHQPVSSQQVTGGYTLRELLPPGSFNDDQSKAVCAYKLTTAPF